MKTCTIYHIDANTGKTYVMRILKDKISVSRWPCGRGADAEELVFIIADLAFVAGIKRLIQAGDVIACWDMLGYPARPGTTTGTFA